MIDFFRHFELSEPGQTKHEQLVSGVIRAISSKEVRSGQTLPPVSSFMQELSVSRMTVLKALSELKDRGIIESRSRVGYFVKSENIKQQLKVLLFLTAFNQYHEILYNSFMEKVKDRNVSVDLFFHHGNPDVLRTVLKEHMGKYGLYIITPIQDRKVMGMLEKIPSDKLLQIVRPVNSKKEISFLSQDFFEEVVIALNGIRERIKSYDEFILVYPEGSFHSPDIKKAFNRFCDENKIIHSIEEKPVLTSIRKNVAYFVIEDSHLIGLIKTAEILGLRLGKDLGILSYNDTPMKEIIRQGITVISTDFQLMGRKAADFALNRRPVHEVMETKITLRKSL